MARYRLLARAFIDGALMEPGSEVEYDGAPGPHMELIEPEKKAEEPPKEAPRAGPPSQRPPPREER